MPNTFAYVVLFSWPIVVMVLFRKLPIPQALVWSIVGGFLMLPTGAALNLPMVPAFDKNSVPVLMAALMCVISAGRDPRAPGAMLGPMGGMGSRGGLVVAQGEVAQAPVIRNRPWGDTLILLLVVILLLGPFLTFLQNREPVIAGPRFMIGLTLYDALSSSGNALFMILPFLLARRFLATVESHRILLAVIAIAAAAYAFLVLFEVRMSPRLSIWIYDYFPHEWRQHLRRDGFRPIVFMEHGLAVGLFLACALISACSLWRSRTVHGGQMWIWVAGWIALALILSKNLGAVMLVVVVAPLALIATRGTAVLAAACIAVIVLTYPVLRTNDWIPLQMVVDVTSSVDESRVGSFRFRVENEEMILQRAAEKPLAGWGGYSRWRVHHEVTGRDLVVSDGLWVIRKASTGWIGYIGMFGLLALPLLLVWRLSKHHEIGAPTVGLMLMMAIVLLYSIPNAFLGPVYWLVAGALAGHYRLHAATVSERLTDGVSETKLHNPAPLLSNLGQR